MAQLFVNCSNHALLMYHHFLQVLLLSGLKQLLLLRLLLCRRLLLHKRARWQNSSLQSWHIPPTQFWR